MRANFLKRLELNGFKSFAHKTVLDFPEGITAIVGPNGSGKSNVIDAIRWLLGEREAKSLRGAKVEDLIFAGTPKKARLGQAQASLYFDNKNGFFPLEFNEVSVLRQVNRNGVSQYFLNKSEVRLKDIIDFFARARLGTKGLVVVTQGNSDVFVQSDSRGRREMIEEMLGLREYQIKKIDAERRLKNSRINLDKVKALIEEILPHLRSLKRQTNRWEKREVVASELKELENKLFGYQFLKLNQKMIAVNDGIENHKKELVALEKEKSKAEENLKNIEASQPKEREEIKKIKEKTQGLLQRRSELQKDIGRLEAQIEISAVQKDEPLPQSSKLIDIIKRVKHGLEAHLEEEDVEELRRVIETLIDEMDEVLAEVGSAPEKKTPSSLKNQFEKINKDLGILDQEINKLKESEKDLEKNQEQFYQSFKAAAALLQEAKNKIEKWEAKNLELRFEKERVEIRVQELERQIVQLERRPSEFHHYKSEEEFSDSGLADLERQVLKRRGDLASIGEIDETLLKEARETEERYTFLEKELGDLEKAVLDLNGMITELTGKIKTEFDGALVKINEEFNKFFHLMFDGGHAKLRIGKKIKREAKDIEVDGENTDADKKIADKVEVLENVEPEEEGIDIELSLPRKRINSLEMLSGGEKSLVGIAALFALISVSPPPFLVLDEIDAALDERNARRFAEMLREFSKKIQFVIVTHNRAVMEAADILYGVTMNEDGTSKVLSLKFES